MVIFHSYVKLPEGKWHIHGIGYRIPRKKHAQVALPKKEAEVEIIPAR